MTRIWALRYRLKELTFQIISQRLKNIYLPNGLHDNLISCNPCVPLMRYNPMHCFVTEFFDEFINWKFWARKLGSPYFLLLIFECDSCFKIFILLESLPLILQYLMKNHSALSGKALPRMCMFGRYNEEEQNSISNPNGQRIQAHKKVNLSK